ncbi:DUF4397 domain-containing protein [Pseudoflavitalea rhizosphaerae]|uniref:DUF4397 domain-containing protein n=1 Tax=Pseudoflavitalea rhizosphaerae TaxID=1884793 RepID=UPI000F8F215A|nr:DUF4397 domain-containing protein [Pseudoflavitalea rhizosphaerae]
MKQIITVTICSLLLIACSKEEPVRQGSTSLLIFHGIAGGNIIRTNFSATPPATFYNLNLVQYGNFFPSSNLYSPVAGSVDINLYHVPDTLPKDEPLISLKPELPEGSMHTLFLAGTTDAPEYTLVKDEPLPFNAGDSAMGVRFVNLLQDNIPVSINIATHEEGSEVNSLPFKGVTEFKKYDVTMDLADYVFEFRNANTGTVIASFTTEQIANDGKLMPNAWIYKNFAFALVGKEGETGTMKPKIAKINYGRVSN